MKTIFTAHSPNTEKDDLSLALSSLFKFNHIRKGPELDDLNKELEQMFSANSYLLDSARSALFVALQAMGIGKGDEVLIQAFNCVAVPNAVIWTGAKPVYVDVGEDLNIDVEALASKITDKTRAILVQHTFGYPADVEKIREIIGDREIYIIEDCAQMLGSQLNGKQIGSIGDAAILSFGRDKAFSSGFGGALIVNNQNLLNKVQDIYSKLEFIPSLWSIREAKYPLLMSLFVKPFFSFFSIGKINLVILQKLHFITTATSHAEKTNNSKPDFIPSKLNNLLASLALHQFQKLEKFQIHRKSLTKFYFESLNNIEGLNFPVYNWKKEFTLLRFPILVHNPKRLFKTLNKKKKIILGDWYRYPVSPKGVSMDSVYYKSEDCPNAESYCSQILNLPLNINVKMNDAERIVAELKEYFLENSDA